MITMEDKQSKPLLGKDPLTMLNINKFKITEAIWLKKILHWGPLENHYVLIKFHGNLPSSSKLISGRETDNDFGMIDVYIKVITTTQISSKSTSRFNMCTHLRSLNVHHLEMAEELRVWTAWSQGHLQCHLYIQNCNQTHESVQKLHHLRCLNVSLFGVINATSSVITSIQNFNQIHQSAETYVCEYENRWRKWERLCGTSRGLQHAVKS
jgi:hypothetical protein